MTTGTWAGTRIGDYRCERFLGAGGMGEVYQAVDVRTGSAVAIKVLTTARRDPALVKRFRNEARIHAALDHPNIGRMYQFLDGPDAPCIVMEYVSGETLEQRLRRGPLPLAEALRLADALVAAVGHMHSHRVLHRDIKSTNVKVTENGVLKLLDFGIAKDAGSPALTADGSVIGTLHSLAPEQLLGVPADRRSDIWALGVVLYEMFTGRYPFGDGNVEEITDRIRAGRYLPATQVTAGLPGRIDAVLGRCLRVDPRKRYPDCDRLRADLAAATTPPAHITTAWRWALPAVGLAAIAAVLLFRRPEPAAPPEQPAVPVAASTGRTDSSATNRRKVTIATVGGSAEVWRDGALIGRTPYRLDAELGASVSLTLRRDGYRDEPVQFTVTEGRDNYSFVLHADRRSSLPPARPPAYAFAWFALPWWRRRKPAVARPMTGRPTLGADGLSIEARIVVGSRTDVGCIREGNEDAFCVVRSSDGRGLLLAAVCDGMGGHAAGETASRLATEVLAAEYHRKPSEPGGSLAEAVRSANRAIYRAARDDQALTGMGTTCTALAIQGGLVWCAHVGDSRCYLIRNGAILLMTEDHSSVMALVRDGTITASEARQHPDKNVILRALGSHPEVEVSTWPQPFVLQPGDRLLLCSDGLYDVVPDDDILASARDVAPREACDALIDLARERGAPDNVTAVMLAVPVVATADDVRITRPIPVVR